MGDLPLGSCQSPPKLSEKSLRLCWTCGDLPVFIPDAAGDAVGHSACAAGGTGRDLEVTQPNGDLPGSLQPDVRAGGSLEVGV